MHTDVHLMRMCCSCRVSVVGIQQEAEVEEAAGEFKASFLALSSLASKFEAFLIVRAKRRVAGTRDVNQNMQPPTVLNRMRRLGPAACVPESRTLPFRLEQTLQSPL